MKRDNPDRKQQYIREELLFRFLKAYDERNLELLEAILQQAENDPRLDTLIWEVFPEYLREEGFSDEKMEHPRLPLHASHSLDWSRADRSGQLPLVIADVAAWMQIEFLLQRERWNNPLNIQDALDILVKRQDPLPDHPDADILRAILQQYKIVVPLSFYTAFDAVAHFLQEKGDVEKLDNGIHPWSTLKTTRKIY